MNSVHQETKHIYFTTKYIYFTTKHIQYRSAYYTDFPAFVKRGIKL